MKADIIRLNKGHFTPLIMYYAKDKKKWERGKKDDCKDVWSAVS